jgi:ABC-type Mn2+/Zn2+ transport system permease subunit
MDWFVDPFVGNAFMVRALLAGVLVALACAVAGTFVVLRGMAFIGDALAHGVMPGVAAALLLGLPGAVGAVAGAVVMIGGVNLVTRRSRLTNDSAIGLMFVGMLALGVVIVSGSATFSGDIVGILFGEILGVGREELLLQLGAAVLVAAVAAVCARPFLLLAVDPEQADTSGFPARRYEVILLLLVALTVVASFQAVGTLLVFGMLVAPAATGALLSSRIAGIMAWAAAIGSLSVYLGLLASYHQRWAAGATMVVVSVVIFFLVLALQNLRGGRAVRVAS